MSAICNAFAAVSWRIIACSWSARYLSLFLDLRHGYLNKIRSSRALETEAKRNLELMWLINCITPDHGTIAGFVQKNKAAFHNTLRNLTLSLMLMGSFHL